MYGPEMDWDPSMQLVPGAAAPSPSGLSWNALAAGDPSATAPRPAPLSFAPQAPVVLDPSQLSPLTMGPPVEPTAPKTVMGRTFADLVNAPASGPPMAGPGAPPPVQQVARAVLAGERAPQRETPQQVAQRIVRGAGGSGSGLKPVSYNELAGIEQRLGDADVQAVRAKQTGAVLQADELDAQRDAAEQRMVLRQARKAREDQQVGERLADLDKTIADVSNTQLDANRMMSGPAGVMAALALAIGTAAGTKDPERIVMGALERDFASQKSNLENKRSNVAAKQNYVSLMRQQFSDRDQADTAAEIAHLEAGKQRIAAMALRKDAAVDEAKVQSATAAIDQKLAQLRERFVMQEQAQAAAQAGAMQRAEDKAFERGLKLYEAETNRMKVEKEGGDKLGVETRFLAEKLGPTSGLEAQAENASELIRKGGTVMNMNTAANAFAQSFPTVYNAVVSDDAAAAQQAYAGFKNKLMNALSGAAVSDKEFERLSQNLENAGTPTARLRAINEGLMSLRAAEATVKAGVSPRAVQEFDRRRGEKKPTYSAPSSFTPGIE